MPCEEAAALHLIATGLQRGLFIDSSCQIGLVVFLRNFDGHIHAVVLNYSKRKRSVGGWFAHVVYAARRDRGACFRARF